MTDRQAGETGRPFPKTFMGNPGDEEKSCPIAKNLLICHITKTPLNRLKSFAVKSFISSIIKQQFSSNHPIRSSFVAAVISTVSYFKFQALCTHMYISMTKALNDWSSPKQNFHSLPPMLCENSASIIACFPLFQTPFFVSHFIKFQLTSLQLRFCGLWAKQI